MAQHDYNLANQSGADFRADLNNALSAIVTVNSGATEPSTTFAHQLWVDTANNVLKVRNAANNAWITTGVSITASNTFTGNLTGNVTGNVTGDVTGNADTATTLATARTINGTSFDGSANISFDTDSVSEGTSNLYFTNERVDDQVNTLLQAGTGIQLTYDDTAGTLTIANTNDADITEVVAGDGLTGGGASGSVSLSVSVDDSSIEINSDSLRVKALGITNDMLAGSIANAKLSNSSVTINSNSLSLGGTLTLDTDDIGEGSTNLYYTDARVNSAFDTRLATKDTDDLSEGSSNLYYTQARFDSAFTAKSTSDLSEGTNLYYTDARARASISEDSTQLSYNSTTGVLSFTQGDTDTVSEGSSNLYYTSARANADFDTRLATKSTTNLSEGTNLYYTTARFDSAFTGKDTDDLSEGSTNLYYTDTRANSAIDTRVTKSFVDSLNVQAASVDANSVALGTDTTGNYVQTITGTANKISVSGSGSESADITLSLPDDVQIASDLTVAGNLTVNGTLTSLDTTNLDIEDNLFQLNAGLTGSPVNDSGMLINRGSSDNGIFMWDESADKFTLGLTTADGSATGNITLSSLGTLVANLEGAVTGNVTGTVSSISNHSTSDLSEGTNLYYTDARFDTRLGTKDTDDVSEGSSNLYYTTARFNSAFSGKSTSDLSEGTNLYYTDTRFDTRLGTKDTGDLSEGSNLYYTDARADARVNLQTGSNLDLSSKSTSDLSEGTNLYYTDARFDTRLGTKDTDDLSEGSSNLYYTDARANSAIDARVTKTFVDNLGIAASTADTLSTARTINGVSFDGSANITTLTAGTGVSVSGTQVSIGQAVGSSDSPTFSNLTLNGTDSIKVPVGTTAQRNGSPTAGMFRYNSTTGEFEGYTTEWGAIAGGGNGSYSTDIFTATSGQTAFTLSASVSNENNLIVFVDGVFQAQNTYSVSGTTLTFATGIVVDRVVTVYHVEPVSIGTPSDGTVTSAKLSGALTTPSDLTVTGDLTVDSTTLVVDASNNRVGIGCTPAQTLHVNSGTSNVVARFESSDSIAAASFKDNNGEAEIGNIGNDIGFFPAGAEKARLTSTGLGINSNSPSTALEVKNASAGATVATFEGTYSSSGDVKLASFERNGGAVAAAVTYADAATAMEFGTTTSHSLILTTGDTERMRITAAGGLQFQNQDFSNIGTIYANQYLANGDADTGIVMQGSNVMSLHTGNSERLRIDASGDVLIGQTSQTGYTFAQKLVVGDGDANDGITIQSGSTHQGNLAFNHSDGTTAHGRISYQHSSNYMSFFTNNTERMRIDNNGAMQIGGTTNAGFVDFDGTKLQLNTQRNPNTGGFVNTSRSHASIELNGADGGSLIVFRTVGSNNAAASERARYTSDGSWFIGTTSEPTGSTGGSGFFHDSAGRKNLALATTATSSADVANFRNPNGTVGRILLSGSSCSFQNLSDYRLKENVDYEFNALDRVAQLKPARFNFIADEDTTVDGFLAHEVSGIVPEAVTGLKDAIDDDGNPEYQYLDVAKLVPLLTKAIQEQQEQIDALKSEINILKGE